MGHNTLRVYHSFNVCVVLSYLLQHLYCTKSNIFEIFITQDTNFCQNLTTSEKNRLIMAAILKDNFEMPLKVVCLSL